MLRRATPRRATAPILAGWTPLLFLQNKRSASREEAGKMQMAAGEGNQIGTLPGAPPGHFRCFQNVSCASRAITRRCSLVTDVPKGQALRQDAPRPSSEDKHFVMKRRRRGGEETGTFSRNSAQLRAPTGGDGGNKDRVRVSGAGLERRRQRSEAAAPRALRRGPATVSRSICCSFQLPVSDGASPQEEAPCVSWRPSRARWERTKTEAKFG